MECCVWRFAGECQCDSSRQELSNDCLIAKSSVDAAENEPSKVSRKEGLPNSCGLVMSALLPVEQIRGSCCSAESSSHRQQSAIARSCGALSTRFARRSALGCTWAAWRRGQKDILGPQNRHTSHRDRDRDSCRYCCRMRRECALASGTEFSK